MKMMTVLMGLLVLAGCATTCYEDDLPPASYTAAN